MINFRIFSSLQRETSYPLAVLLHFSSPQLLATANLLSVSMDLPIMHILDKGNYSICGILWLVSFTLSSLQNSNTSPPYMSSGQKPTSGNTESESDFYELLNCIPEGTVDLSHPSSHSTHKPKCDFFLKKAALFLEESRDIFFIFSKAFLIKIWVLLKNKINNYH